MARNAWLQAARPLAHANIAPPLLYGQALAYAAYGTFGWELFAAAHVFGVLNHLFIVFANDAADWPADVTNTTYNRYSGGSRVVPEGKLTPKDLAVASMASLLGMAGVSLYLVFFELRMFMLVACSLAAGLIWAYSFAPIRLSYRGGGEWLQGLGVGVLLPLIGFYVQTGVVWPIPWEALAGGLLLGFGGNVLTALPDTPSDEAAHKRTVPVRRGETTARIIALGAIATAAMLIGLAADRASLGIRVAATVVPLVPLTLALPMLGTADSSDRAACERFVTLGGAAITAAWLVGGAALAFG